ncbi:MAG: protein translocase subunit SecF [Parcubacteria group bacterium]|nr:protein translocase subunit SecF [Parcubacteria group bacterium]
MFVIKYKKYFLALSAFFIVVSLTAIGVLGLQFGIDFTGGSILEVRYEGEVPEAALLEARLVENGFLNAVLQPTGEKGYIFRTETLKPEDRSLLLTLLNVEGETPFEEVRFSQIGGVIGKELQSKAWIAIAITLLSIILYITYAFRKVSEPVSSWKYGVAAVVALLHNTVIPIGAFAILGHYFALYQIDVLFVTAILAIFGFSVNDTIVIFDRIRENLRRDKEEKSGKPFGVVVGESISQTLARSINISLAILLVLGALYFIGSDSTREFSFVLGLGVLFGTYSSICFAAPLLVAIGNRTKQKATH